MQSKITKIAKTFPHANQFKLSRTSNKEKKILAYLKHFLIAKQIERIVNNNQYFAEAICKAILSINFADNTNFLQLHDVAIKELGQPANLLKVASLINCPRETVRRKAEILLRKKFIQKKGQHQYFITKKWLQRSKEYLLLMHHSTKHS
jgi:hypothetical protein